jgi:signal peptide peptidase SppA
MRDFLKNVLATLTGLMLFGFLGAGALTLILLSATTQVDEVAELEEKTVLVYDLSLIITDRPLPTGPSLGFDFESDTDAISLLSLLKALDEAARDDKIAALYLVGDPFPPGAGYATLQEVRQALVKFQESGKPIIAYSTDWGERDYYLASVADSIFMNPLGSVTMDGLRAEVQFYAGALEKYGVGMQIIRVGKYKSAVEPFTEKGFTADNRQQTQTLLDDVWQELLTDIGQGRALEVAQLQTIADKTGLLLPDEAQAKGLVDGVKYEDEMRDTLYDLTQLDNPGEDLKSEDVEDTENTGDETEAADGAVEAEDSEVGDAAEITEAQDTGAEDAKAEDAKAETGSPEQAKSETEDAEVAETEAEDVENADVEVAVAEESGNPVPEVPETEAADTEAADTDTEAEAEGVAEVGDTEAAETVDAEANETEAEDTDEAGTDGDDAEELPPLPGSEEADGEAEFFDDYIPNIDITAYARRVASEVDGSEIDHRIAVVYAEGEIVSGAGGRGFVGSDEYVELLREIREDEVIKAVVLRINSPGGGATAAGLIQREIELLQAEKPVIVSMGDVAASGGYWIAAPADLILAESMTVTGSIGVFGLLPNFQKLANDNGITWDAVTTGTYANIETIARPKTQAELALYQRFVDDVYTRFLATVAQGRDLSEAKVGELAQGRVWSGVSAKQVRLVDELGGLDAALRAAADAADLGANWLPEEYPPSPSFEEEIIERIFGDLEAVLGKGKWGKRKAAVSLAPPIADLIQGMETDWQLLTRLDDPRSAYTRLPYRLQIR